MSNPTAFKCGQLCDAYIKLWSARTKGIDREIENMLNNLRDPIAKAVLRYIQFLRSRSKDVLIKWNAKIYNPISRKVSYSPSRLIVLHAIPAENAYWLYFYVLDVGDFTVLKAKKSDSLEMFLQVAYGHVIKLYTISGKVRHFTGINKSKRYGSRNNPVKYEYRYNKENNASMPCITKDDFENHKAFYKYLLSGLGIVPPLIVELPPNDADSKPGMGLILPIRYNENAIRTYILPIDTILTLDAKSFYTFDKFVASLDDLVKRHNLFPPWHVKVENIKCEGLWTYLYNKNIEEYLRLLMDELRASSNDLSKAINNGELRENYVNLIDKLHRDCKCDCGLNECDCSLKEYINEVWQQKSGLKSDVSKKEVIRDLLNNVNSAMKLLNYLPKPIAIELYGLDYIKRVIKALLCLRSQSH
jgi:hypothetical protein